MSTLSRYCRGCPMRRMRSTQGGVSRRWRQWWSTIMPSIILIWRMCRRSRTKSSTSHSGRHSSFLCWVPSTSSAATPAARYKPWPSNYYLVYWWSMGSCSNTSSGRWCYKASCAPPSSRLPTPPNPSPSRSNNSKTGSESLSNSSSPPSTP